MSNTISNTSLHITSPQNSQVTTINNNNHNHNLVYSQYTDIHANGSRLITEEILEEILEEKLKLFYISMLEENQTLEQRILKLEYELSSLKNTEEK